MDVRRPLIDTVPLRVWPVMDSTAWTGAVGLAQAIPVIAYRPFTRPTTCASDQRRIHPPPALARAGARLCRLGGDFPGICRCLGVLVPVAARSWLAVGGGAAARALIRRLVPAAQGSAGLALNRIIFQAVMLSSGGIRRGEGF
jgi:hypothetical protein